MAGFPSCQLVMPLARSCLEPEEVPAGMVMGHTSCGCHFQHLCLSGHLSTPCPGAQSLLQGLGANCTPWDPSCSQHLPGLVQPHLLKCRQALESLNSSTSLWSCNECSSPRTSWRQKPSQLAHPQMSSGSEKNLIFPLQGEEERWKNRIRYAPTRKKPLPLPPSTYRICLPFGDRTSERLPWPLLVLASSLGPC